MDIKEETEHMKEDAKKLFKDKEDRKEFCDWCDKKIKDCEHLGKHPKKKPSKSGEEEEEF